MVKVWQWGVRHKGYLFWFLCPALIFFLLTGLISTASMHAIASLSQLSTQLKSYRFVFMLIQSITLFGFGSYLYFKLNRLILNPAHTPKMKQQLRFMRGFCFTLIGIVWVLMILGGHV